MVVRSVLLILYTLFAMLAGAGNGSSTIGNGSIKIANNLWLDSFDNAIYRKENLIFDASTEDAILVISPYSQEQSGAAVGQLVEVKLGKVKGLEFVPYGRIGTTGNFWVICESAFRCLKLSAVSSAAGKITVPMIVGSLREGPIPTGAYSNSEPMSFPPSK